MTSEILSIFKRIYLWNVCPNTCKHSCRLIFVSCLDIFKRKCIILHHGGPWRAHFCNGPLKLSLKVHLKLYMGAHEDIEGCLGS